MVRSSFNLPFAVFALAGLLAITTGVAIKHARAESENIAAQNSESPALRVANAYLVACSKANVEELNALFLAGGRATVLENAGDEGTWEQYRDHHLMPELEEFKGITVTVKSQAEQKFGTTSVVRQTGSFEVPDPANPNQPRKIMSAMTYVIVEDAGSPKIAHLHWSSRAARPTTQPAPPAR